MKCFKIVLALVAFTCFSSVCYSADSHGQLSSKFNLQYTSASDVAARANRNPSTTTPDSALMDNPILNAEMNGIGNMIQGMTGNTGGYSYVQDQMKQQMEYSRQQLEY